MTTRSVHRKSPSETVEKLYVLGAAISPGARMLVLDCLYCTIPASETSH